MAADAAVTCCNARGRMDIVSTSVELVLFGVDGVIFNGVAKPV